LRFVRTSAETDGASVEVEAVYRAHSPPPPRHFHPHQEEQFHVVEGRLRFELGGASRDVAAGETIVVPTGAIHRAWNPDDEPARATWITRPALQTERFFETLWGLAQDGHTNERGAPNLLRIALIARHFADTWVLANPPRPVQSCLFAVLAPIARLVGYRAEYTPRGAG
jgi:quercetin dioxygenase-like cupin family protein